MRQIATKHSTTWILVLALTFGVFVSCLVNPATAYADNTDADAALAATQQQVEQATQDYNDAADKVAGLQSEIDDNQKKIDDLQAALPGQQEKAANAMVALYKMQSSSFSLVNMVLNTSTIEEFFSSIQYITTIQQTNINEVIRLQQMNDDLQATKTSLQKSKTAADSAQAQAQQALQDAQAAKEAAQKKADEEAAARAEQAKEAAAAAAAAQAAADAAAAAAQDSQSASSGYIDPLPAPGGVDFSMDKDSFVNEWAPRIDAYLAGSPLAGQGVNFATAAWNYGVDPRFSPAISNTESSKGLYCFLPYNAWGWGQVSWGSWAEAIDAHVRGLAAGYGPTITVWGAQKYCPPNWEHWYYSTLAEMEKI